MATDTTAERAVEGPQFKPSEVELSIEYHSREPEQEPDLASPMPEFNPLIQTQGLTHVSRFAVQPLDISDFGCHDTSSTAPNGPQAPGSQAGPETSLPGVVDNASADIDGLPVHNLPVPEEPHQEQQSPPGLELAKQIANDEWHHQHMQTDQREDVHHFNFLGDGVPCKNATPPAVSLLVSASGAKAGFAKIDDKGDTNPHGFAVMRSAMKLVDPVIYHGPPEYLELRGENLREAVTGLCDKFYSEHGMWQTDDYYEEDRPLVDYMNVLRYPIESLPVNGWFQSGYLMDRADLNTQSYNATKWEEQQQQKSLRYRRKHRSERSPLWQMTSMKDLDVFIEEESEVPSVATASNTGSGTKRFDSSWTVDLDEIFGKCDDWSDEVDENNEAALVEQDRGCPIEASLSPDHQVERTSEPESEKQTASVGLESSVSDADIDSGINTLQEPGVSQNRSADDQNDELTETSPLQSAMHSSGTHDPPLKKDTASDALKQSIDALTEDELQAEDREIHGDSALASQEVESLLQRLHESQLITRDVDTCSASQSSSEDKDNESSASTSDLERLFADRTFSLSIRPKPATKVDDARTASANDVDVASSQVSLSCSNLPICGKVPRSADLHNTNVFNLSAETHNNSDPPTSAFKDTEWKDPSIRPSEHHSQKASLDLEDNDVMEADEHMAPISVKTPDCTVMPLRPRKPHTRRLTDPSAELLETLLEAWSGNNTLNSGTATPAKATVNSASTSLPATKNMLRASVVPSAEMLKAFDKVCLPQLSKRPSITRSPSLPNLAQLAAEKAPLRNGHHSRSLGSSEGSQRAPIRVGSNATFRSKSDNLYPIIEDEAEWDTGMSSDDDETSLGSVTTDVAEASKLNFITGDSMFDDERVEHHLGTELSRSAVSPIRLPYKRPASNTPLKMMGKGVRLDLLADVDSSDSVEEMDVLSEIDDHSTDPRHAGKYFCYALKNWNAVFPNDSGADIGQPLSVNLEDVPTLGCRLPSTGASSATADSEVASVLRSSSISTEDTEATSLTIESPKTAPDVEYIDTTPSQSRLDEIKSKLNAQLSMSKQSSKKTNVKKSFKKFFRKSLESFAVIGRLPVF